MLIFHLRRSNINKEGEINIMGNVYTVLTPLLHGVMKLAGLTPQSIEIEPGTLMNIWVPKETVTSTTRPHKQTIYVPPKKPAVLLVHCFAFNGIFTWFLQVLALTGKYSVYVPDLLFFGGSTTDRPERSPSFQAEFLAKGLEILRVEKVTVVGLSYGGTVGFKMAKLYPNLVDSMVLSSTVIELTESVSLASYRTLCISSWPELLLPETVEVLKRELRVGTYKFPWLPDFCYRNTLEVMFSNRKERNELLAALVVPDNDANTDTVYSQRIHMLWGDDDKIFPLDLAETMRKRLGSKATLECIRNAGHLVQIEKPRAYNRSLKKFLQSLHKHDHIH